MRVRHWPPMPFDESERASQANQALERESAALHDRPDDRERTRHGRPWQWRAIQQLLERHGDGATLRALA